MYVVPEFRSNGSSEKLLLALIDAVRQLHDMEQLNLRVTHQMRVPVSAIYTPDLYRLVLRKTRFRSMACTTTRNI